MAETVMLMAGPAFLFVVTCGMVWTRKGEKAQWNGGHCGDCGNSWYRFDTDSQGGRGYVCGQGHYMWASYRVD